MSLNTTSSLDSERLSQSYSQYQSDRTYGATASSSEDRFRRSRSQSSYQHSPFQQSDSLTTANDPPRWAKNGRRLSGTIRHRHGELHQQQSRTIPPLITDATGSFYLLEAEDPNEFNIVETAENEVEARKMLNNYMFGLRIWKSHVTSQSISNRSQTVQELYADDNDISLRDFSASKPRLSNFLYTIFMGWWLSLLYMIIGALLFATAIGRYHGLLCFKLASYLFWPFQRPIYQISKPKRGNFKLSDMSSLRESANDNAGFKADEDVTLGTPSSENVTIQASNPDVTDEQNTETATAEEERRSQESQPSESGKSFLHWNEPGTYAWMILGLPVLLLTHGLIIIVTWLFVFTIPIAKMNKNIISKVLFAAPYEIEISDFTGNVSSEVERQGKRIILTYQSFNLNYYKLTVDGVNVILANLLTFVVLTIFVGMIDRNDELVPPIIKCVMGILAILPMTYYVGMAITSISAQSSLAVGALLNATFGSMVEVILFIIMLKKGKDEGETCYMELVKSTLTGSILCCILLVPGLSMVIGGIKYRRQNFNPRSANVTSSLLFVAIMGVFAPTIFSKIYGNLECEHCELVRPENTSTFNVTGFLCSGCRTVTVAPNNDRSLFQNHIKPLMYICAIILPLSYIIGLVFFMKTHTSDVFDEFERLQREEGVRDHHSNAQWSRLKSGIILSLSATAISLCAENVANNIAPLLNKTGISEYFMGVTLLSIVSMLPELVNGIQFAVQNNVNLGIEIGSAAAIQVCMVQLPVIVLADLIYPLNFGAVFNDIHLWAIIFAVIIINYVFQDGKSNYFQGSIVVFIYLLIMAMYFFTVTPETAVCKKQ